MCGLRRCCCCFSLRTGALITGYYQTVSVFWLLAGFIVTVITKIIDLADRAINPWDYIKAYYISLICEFAIYALFMVVGVLLIIGVKQNKPHLLTLWLVLEILGLIILFLYTFYWIHQFTYSPDNTICIAYIPIGAGICCFPIVFNLRKEMKGVPKERLAQSGLDDHMSKVEMV